MTRSDPGPEPEDLSTLSKCVEKGISEFNESVFEEVPALRGWIKSFATLISENMGDTVKPIRERFNSEDVLVDECTKRGKNAAIDEMEQNIKDWMV